MTSEDTLHENDRIKLAVLIREVKGLSENVRGINDTVIKFIELTEKKVDKQIYLEDKKHNERLHEMVDKRVARLENIHQDDDVAKKARADQKNKILGLSKGAWFVIMQAVNLLILFGILGSTK